MITKKRFIVDLLDDDNDNETEQFIRKYGADEITGMTNGDVILALFPDAKVEYNGNHVVYVIIGGVGYGFNAEWWNAPYRRENK